MKLRKAVGVVLNIAVCMLLAQSAQAADSRVLDGKSFAGTVTMQGEAKGDPDTFEFKNGQFHSTACDQYGYGTGAYSTQTKNGVTTFDATTKNDKAAPMRWQASIQGPALTGPVRPLAGWRPARRIPG